jgi:HK97 family phage major capsid protein/HK97 family phage prohead protease
MPDLPPLEIKVDPAGTIVGYASLPGRPADRHGDIVEPGAANRSLQRHNAEGTQPAMLVEHRGEPVGFWTAIGEDDIGLRAEGRLSLTSEAGRKAYADARDGRLSGLSIGYTALSVRRDGRFRSLEEIDLVEISLVARPASDRARILQVKSEAPMDPEDAPAAAEQQAPAPVPQTKAAPTPPPADDRLDRVLAGVEAVGKKFDGLAGRVDALERKAARPTVPATPAKEAKAVNEAWEHFLRRGPGHTETKSLRLSDDESAGYLAPPEFVAEIDKQITPFSPVRQVATVRNTSRSEVTTLRRTQPASAVWVGEEEERSETDMKYGANTYPVHELATYVDVSLQMLEDSAIDVAAEIAAEFAEAFGSAEAIAFVKGSGIKRPMGFMVDDTIGQTPSGAAAKITADGLINIYHAVKSPYRPNAIWGMNSATMAAVRKLKTDMGEYLVQTAGLAGSPATTLLGRPIVEMPDMPDISAGEYPIIFGDFRIGYRIFDRLALSIVRDDLTQRTKGRVRFHGRRRVAGGVRRAEALRKLKISS